eukprot:Sspe_Gene.74888::Locus_46800_Transcript_1_2_Confidence_0.667_Length_670::g.74888::m.74888
MQSHSPCHLGDLLEVTGDRWAAAPREGSGQRQSSPVYHDAEEAVLHKLKHLLLHPDEAPPAVEQSRPAPLCAHSAPLTPEQVACLHRVQQALISRGVHKTLGAKFACNTGNPGDLTFLAQFTAHIFSPSGGESPTPAQPALPRSVSPITAYTVDGSAPVAIPAGSTVFPPGSLPPDVASRLDL